MSKIKNIGLIAITLISFMKLSAQQKTSDQKLPNIIFILTDDLGYGDIGVFFQNQRKLEGKPYHQTPQLDKMAREGMMLTRHYVPAPVCAPSRASLLLGVHQGHAEVRNNQFDKALPDNHNMATVLKEAGYATAIVGKYGLQGTEGNSPGTWEAYPTKRGFDYFFGYVRHRDGHNHYPAHEAPERPPVELYSGTEEISDQLNGCYTTDLFTAMAKKWITEHRNNHAGQPFFMYLAYNTPHAGLQVASTPYPSGGGLNGGVKWLGKTGKYINTVTDTIDNYIHPDYNHSDWPDVQKRTASMIRRIDDGIGDVLQLLDDLGINEETVVIFTSDNGPHHESYGYGDYTPTFFDSYGPLDGTKRDTWEGGIRVPTIVRWPNQVPEDSQNDTPSAFYDWLPTFAQLAHVPAPAVTDGVSLLPLLTGKGSGRQGKVYVEYTVNGETPSYEAFHESHKGQKRGEMQVLFLDGYKGIRYNISSADDDFRIYDTRKDPGEENNLAGSNIYYKDLQKKLKRNVLQLRRPNLTAPRPYDSVPVPSVPVEGKLKNGLRYQLFNVTTPWVPDVSSLRHKADRKGTVEGVNTAVGKETENMVIAYEGYLSVPATGEYTFHFKTNGGAILRLHDATIIDADKGYKPGTAIQSTALLEEGYHPFKLVFKSGTDSEPDIRLTWSGSNFQEKIMNQHFFY